MIGCLVLQKSMMDGGGQGEEERSAAWVSDFMMVVVRPETAHGIVNVELRDHQSLASADSDAVCTRKSSPPCLHLPVRAFPHPSSTRNRLP